LGGASFPPTLYYKVFLLNALCDVGSFAPRNYAAQHPNEPARQHSHGARRGQEPAALGQIRVGGRYFGTRVAELGPDGTSQWYKRVENNGWRAVTHRAATDAARAHGPSAPESSGSALAAAQQPPHGAVSAAERASLSGGTAFHYSRVKRAEDKAAARKAKKRAWLQHMYRDGLARERTGGDDGGNAVGADTTRGDRKGPGKGLGAGFSGQGNGIGLTSSARLEDLGVEDLAGVLAWSAELDYEAYVANWHVLATSATSGANYHIQRQRAVAPAAGAGAAAARSRRAAGAAVGSCGAVPEPDWIALNEQLQAEF
jgi:hypothetical protein